MKYSQRQIMLFWLVKHPIFNKIVWCSDGTLDFYYRHPNGPSYPMSIDSFIYGSPTYLAMKSLIKC